MKRGANTPAELEARAINAEPWAAPPGYWKRRCSRCSYWFATPARAQSAVCPDCTAAIMAQFRRELAP